MNTGLKYAEEQLRSALERSAAKTRCVTRPCPRYEHRYTSTGKWRPARGVISIIKDVFYPDFDYTEAKLAPRNSPTEIPPQGKRAKKRTHPKIDLFRPESEQPPSSASTIEKLNWSRQYDLTLESYKSLMTLATKKYMTGMRGGILLDKQLGQSQGSKIRVTRVAELFMATNRYTIITKQYIVVLPDLDVASAIDVVFQNAHKNYGILDTKVVGDPKSLFKYTGYLKGPPPFCNYPNCKYYQDMLQLLFYYCMFAKHPLSGVPLEAGAYLLYVNGGVAAPFPLPDWMIRNRNAFMTAIQDKARST